MAYGLWTLTRKQLASAASIASLSLAFAGASFAQAPAPSTSQLIEGACAGKTSNVEYKQCLAEFAAKVDRDLNALWPRVLASIDGQTHLKPAQRADWKRKLTVAQRHWVQFKEADCREPVGYEWYGGTGMGGAVSACTAKHIIDRMQDLKARYLEK
jgi:uncharacterized protein YecT (DUF1311 family)